MMDKEAARKREYEFLSSDGDAAAVYRFDSREEFELPESLKRVPLAGKSPIVSGYDLISTGPITPGVDTLTMLNEYRANGFTKSGDVVAFKQAGTVTCWYVDFLAYSKLPGLLNSYNQIDGIINNEAPKPSLLDTLRQCQEDAGKSQGGAVPRSPSRDMER